MATNIKFGTDGWRGVIAWDFTFENVRRVAQALADFINENAPAEEEGKTSKIFVGYDRRFMSDIFAGRTHISNKHPLNPSFPLSARIRTKWNFGPAAVPLLSSRGWVRNRPPV